MTPRQLLQMQRNYRDQVAVRQYDPTGRSDGKDVWIELGVCSCLLIERATVAFRGTSQAQSADATVDILRAPAVITDRNKRFELTVYVMPSDTEAAAALQPGGDLQDQAKRTIKYEVAQAETVRDLGGGEVVTTCRVVLARATK